MTTPNQQSNVKRFVAANMTRALELVRAEMGPEAVILSSKKVDKGVEIITSLEPDLPTRGIDVRREFGRNFDAELDRAMPSDNAWKATAGIEQAASSYESRTELNAPAGFYSREPSYDLSQEIERAREKMLAAKRQAKNKEHTLSDIANGATEKPNPHSVPEQEASGKSNVQYMNEERSLASPRSEGYHVSSTSGVADDERLHELQNELADMRMLLEQQLWHMSETRSVNQPFHMQQQIKMPVQERPAVLEHLERLGLSKAMVTELANGVNPSLRVSEAWRACMTSLSKSIPVAHADLISGGGGLCVCRPNWRWQNDNYR